MENKAMLKITVSPQPIRATIFRTTNRSWCFRDANGKVFCQKNNFARKEYAVNAAKNMGFTEIA